MPTNDKRARAFDYLSEMAEAGIVSAPALLSVLFNILSADDFVSMAEDEFEWNDEEEETDDPDTDDGDDCPDCGNTRIVDEGDGKRCESCVSGVCNDLDDTTSDEEESHVHRRRYQSPSPRGGYRR